jgi:hypothetical protein
MPRKYKLTEKEAIEWAVNHECVMKYLSKINSNKPRAACDIFFFCDWAGKTPEELLAMKTDFQNFDVEGLLDKWVISKLEYPETRKWIIINTVRGFFRANWRQLQADAGKMEEPFACSSDKPKPLSQKKRRVFFNNCYTPRDKALVAVVSCSAIALETLSKLHWYHFEEDWINQEIPNISLPSELLKGHGKGKYRGVQQETFITPEAKTVLLDYRNWFAKVFNYQWNDDDYVFLQVRHHIGEPLVRIMIAKTFAKISLRSGVTWKTHDGRRIVQTALESVGCPNNWIKKVKGRKCSGEEAPYSKPAIEQLRSKYREAIPQLEFLTDRVEVKRDDDELNRLKAENFFLMSRLERLEAKIDGMTNYRRKPRKLRAKPRNCKR